MYVLLTGPPGVGKTTLVKKVAETLLSKKQDSFKVDGFFTEELRDENQTRKGFDVVSINNLSHRKPLALANAPPALRGPKVGKYTVMIEDFESVALKSMSQDVDILIIDEIGKKNVWVVVLSYPNNRGLVFAKSNCSYHVNVITV